MVFETAMFLLIQLLLLVLKLSIDKRYFVPTDFFPLYVLLQFYGQLFVDINFEQLSLRFVCCPYLPLSGFNMGKKSRRQCWEKYCLIKMTPDYDYGVQTSFTLHLFFILLLLCSYQKHETTFFYYLISKEIKFGHTQISVPKIDIPMLKTFCTNPWVFEVSCQGHPF